MIWVGGEIVEDHALRVGVLDRTFEHGLGLFETLRTWGGLPTLLDRHLARLQGAATTLGLILDPRDLPDASAVKHLLEADRFSGDRMLRITVSGGMAGSKSLVWMRSAPLPSSPEGMTVVLSREPIAHDEPLSRFKTLNYWSRRLSYERALAEGADEALRLTPDGRVWSGCRTNLFIVRGDAIATPGLRGPIVPGILREVTLSQARRSGLDVSEQDVSVDDLAACSEMFLTNAVRGVLPVATFEGRKLSTPGAITGRLRREILDRLHRGECAP